MRTVKISKQINIDDNGSSHRLRIYVSASTNVAPEIFVYQIYRNPPSSVLVDDEFVHVASPADMVEYATTAVAGKNYYRKSYVDMYFRSPDLLLQTLESIEQNINELLRTLAALDEAGTSSESTFQA